MRMLMKTASYWGVHITVASGLAYLLTGDWQAAIGIGLLEPTVQAGVFYLHERLWESRRNRAVSSTDAATGLNATKVTARSGGTGWAANHA